MFKYSILLSLMLIACSGPLDIEHQTPEAAALDCFRAAGYEADTIPTHTVEFVEETHCDGDNIIGCALDGNHIQYVGDNPSRQIQIHEQLHLLYWDEVPYWAHHDVWPDELPKWCLEELEGSF